MHEAFALLKPKDYNGALRVFPQLSEGSSSNGRCLCFTEAFLNSLRKSSNMARELLPRFTGVQVISVRSGFWKHTIWQGRQKALRIITSFPYWISERNILRLIFVGADAVFEPILNLFLWPHDVLLRA